MSKVDYSLKFYQGFMTNDNQETYNFYLAARTANDAYYFLENYVRKHASRFHIIPGEVDIYNIRIEEVPLESYGKRYGFEVIN